MSRHSPVVCAVHGFWDPKNSLLIQALILILIQAFILILLQALILILIQTLIFDQDSETRP